MLPSAQYWIKKLDLQPHPEGGYFKEMYRSAGTFLLPDQRERAFATAIYFLLLEDKFSAFHRIKSDEAWHFYAGTGIEVISIDEHGKLLQQTVGSDFENGEQFQVVVPANTWFAARMTKPDSFGLVGCTVSPGFDFHDFEMANRVQLSQQFPDHASLISELTYPA